MHMTFILYYITKYYPPITNRRKQGCFANESTQFYHLGHGRSVGDRIIINYREVCQPILNLSCIFRGAYTCSQHVYSFKFIRRHWGCLISYQINNNNKLRLVNQLMIIKYQTVVCSLFLFVVPFLKWRCSDRFDF